MPDQVFNPLGFYCPPNGSTPDYIAYHDFRQWLAYGLMCCWLSHDADDPNADCSFSRPVTRQDVEELRCHFLDLVETVLGALWTGDYRPGDGCIDGDWQTLFIDTGDDDPDPTILAWYPRLDDDALMFELTCSGADSEVIWLRYEALQDRHGVVEVLREARQHVHDHEVWSRLVELAQQQPTEHSDD